ncbi:MAG: FAD-binding oxidoreductase [Balneolaceae bacterium]
MLRPFKVIKKVKESDEITSFYLQPNDDKGLIHFRPGQYLPIKVEVPSKDKVVYRNYTLSDRPGKDYYRLTIKREKNGLVSSYMHESVSEGDVIQAESPRGNFYLPEDRDTRPIVLLSGGVGITPMLSILNHVVDNDTDREVWFIHGSRNINAQIKLDKLRLLDESKPNIHVHIHHSRPVADEIRGYDFDREGIITPEFLKSYLLTNEALFFLCGPSPFMEALYKGLIEWNVPEEHILYEYFGQGKVLESQSIFLANGFSEAITVYFSESEIEALWDDSFSSILQLAESKGLSPPFDCRMGSCTTCESELISGEVDYEPEPFVEVEDGRVLICCARPKSDVKIDL